MVLRIAVGERVADGDIARMPANTVSKASAASPVRITIALASDTVDDSKIARVIASSSARSWSLSYSSVARANVVWASVMARHSSAA